MTLQVGMVITGNSSDAQQAIGQLSKKTRQFGDSTERANAEASRSFKQLKASIDPVYRAELNLKRTQDLLNQSVRSGAISQAEAIRVLHQYTAATKGGSVAAGQMSRRLSSGVSKQRRFGLAVQNTSYQLGDFAVQVGSGQNAMLALGQQLPQLLGGFGIMGAVMGAAVAIAVPLVRVLFGTADAAEANVDPLEKLSTSLDAYRAASKDANASTEDLVSTYGTASAAVRELLELQEELTLRQAKLDLTAGIASLFDEDSAGGLIGSIRDQLTAIDPTDTISPAAFKLLGDLDLSYAALSETLGITEDNARELFAALDATASAGSPEEQLARLTGIREGYLGLIGEVGDLTDEQAAFLQEIKNAELEAQKLVATAGGIAPSIDTATTSANNLLAALSAANAASITTGGGRGADPRSFTSETTGTGYTFAEYERKFLRPERPAGGGSGGGASATTAESNAVQKLIDGLQQEIDLLGELDPINQEMLKLRGQLKEATEAEIEAVRSLIETRNEEREALDAHISQLDTWREGARGIFDMIVDGARQGTSALDILLNVLFDLGSKLTSMAGDSLIDALFGSSGSASGGAIGGSLTDFFGSLFKFADGGVVNSPTMFGFGNGQTGLMGEAGPEAIMPLSHAGGSGIGAQLGGRETTLPLTRLTSGKLGVSITPFANGGAFGAFSAPRSRPADVSGSQREASGFGNGPTVINNWNVSSENPRSFAEGKATTARAASKLIAGIGRYT